MVEHNIFELGKQIKCSNIEFTICPNLWNDFEFIAQNIDIEKIEEIKYLNDDGKTFNDEIEKLPNSGGVYFFIIKSLVLTEMVQYLVYVGRAKKTENHNLKIRCKKYLNNYNNEAERPKVSRMLKDYGKHLYLKYIDLGDNNKLIDELEAKIINNLLPPFNSRVPDKKIQKAVSAFK